MVMHAGVCIERHVVLFAPLVVVGMLLLEAGHRNLEDEEGIMRRVSLGPEQCRRVPVACRPGDRHEV